MIKNTVGGTPSVRWALVVGALALAGCKRAPPVPPGFQGVVEHEQRVVSFEAGGTVLAVAVRRGDEVRAGDALATLDDRLEVLTRAARAGEVDVARADLALLEAGSRKEDVSALASQLEAAKATEALLAKTEARLRPLYDKGSITLAELDRAEADHARARAEVASLRSRLAALQKGARAEELTRARTRVDAGLATVALSDERVRRYVAKTLVSGTVLDVHVEPGELAGAGTPIVTIADTARPYIDVFVPQAELAGVRVGAAASLRVDASASPYAGKVEWISPRTEFTPRYLFSDRERSNLVVRVRVRLDDPGRELHAGVPGFVEIAR